MGKFLALFLLLAMGFLPQFAAEAAVEAGTVRVMLARQSAPVNFIANGNYQLVNQTSGQVAGEIQKDENWQVRLEGGRLQLQGPDGNLGPFSEPVAVVQKNGVRLNVIAGNRKVVEKNASGGLAAINAGGQAMQLSDSSVLSVRSMGSVLQLREAGAGLGLVALQIGPEYKRYRGKIEFRIENENLAVINELNIEDYLRGVVAAEMPASWPAEALKAQAVVARNYALQKVEASRGDSYNLTNDQMSQVYRGYDGETKATNQAVSDTRGIVLINKGSLISSFFHSSSGGFTENSEDVWLNPLPYLKTKSDPYDQNSQHYNWLVKYANEQLTNKLKTEKYPFAQITDIEVAERTASGARAKKLVVSGLGSDGKTIRREIQNADNVRSALGLKSALFTIKKNYEEKNASTTVKKDQTQAKDNDTGAKTGQNVVKPGSAGTGKYLAGIEITGSGYGHGLGLSQYGAYGLAKQGYNYQDILKYYYTDVSMASDYGRQ